jgi:hypothetical protein
VDASAAKEETSFIWNQAVIISISLIQDNSLKLA